MLSGSYTTTKQSDIHSYHLHRNHHVFNPLKLSNVYSKKKKTPDHWQRTKTCRFSFQNKFDKLVHLVGFIIKICHDAVTLM
jgi:hypothetical protein